MVRYAEIWLMDMSVYVSMDLLVNCVKETLMNACQILVPIMALVLMGLLVLPVNVLTSILVINVRLICLIVLLVHVSIMAHALRKEICFPVNAQMDYWELGVNWILMSVSVNLA